MEEVLKRIGRRAEELSEQDLGALWKPGDSRLAKSLIEGPTSAAQRAESTSGRKAMSCVRITIIHGLRFGRITPIKRMSVLPHRPGKDSMQNGSCAPDEPEKKPRD
jgi:hypothetical protein